MYRPIPGELAQKVELAERLEQREHERLNPPVRGYAVPEEERKRRADVRAAEAEEARRLQLAEERRDFIRDAVLEAFAGSLTLMSPAELWERARKLWAAKPEDC
jgi:hypothetical protein